MTTKTATVKPVAGDVLVYRRAITAAVAGLVIQLALCLAVGLTGLWGDSQAIYAAAWHMLGGLPIWIVLALIYQQHESERVQRLAAEKLANSSQATAAILSKTTSIRCSVAMQNMTMISGRSTMMSAMPDPTKASISNMRNGCSCFGWGARPDMISEFAWPRRVEFEATSSSTA